MTRAEGAWVGRSRLLNIALACVSILAACAAVEVGLRISGSYRPPADPIQTKRPDLYRADPHVGYTLWPSKTTAYRYPAKNEGLIPLVANADGFRAAREFGERDGRIRIVVVGDSFVFGEGVRAEDRFTEQLESLDRRWRVDNMGMPGWGLDLMIRAIEQYGRKADPRIVVLSVYTDSFRRLLPYYAGVGYAYPKFELKGSELTTVPFPYPRFWERLRLVQLVYQTRWQRERNRYDLHRALLDRYLQIAREMGFMPVVVFFPGKSDTAEDQERRGFLRAWAVSHGVQYGDLTSAIHAAGIEEVYIRDNWHWNPLGHRIAAIELGNLLRRELDMPGPPS